MIHSGAQILVKALEKEGVDLIFGYPGGAVLEIYDELEKSSIDHVLVRHEQASVHGASGYARASNKVGVALATSGPGATNLVTGIATAYMDSVPLVIITGQVPRILVGTDAFQEVDITGITAPVIKYNYLVQDVKDLPKVVAEAFYIARSGRPGPVLIDIPSDVSRDECEYIPYNKVNIRSYKPTIKGHPEMIKKAVKMIKESQFPLLCVGGGVISSNCYEEVKKLQELTQANVVSTMMGLGGFPSDDQVHKGMLGTYGHKKANEFVQKCDLFLALGMRFDDRVVGNSARFAPNAKVIHIDIDPAEIGKNINPDLPIVGDLQHILKDINKHLEKEKKSDIDWNIESIEKWENLMVPEILRKVSELVPKETIFTTDVGQHQLWSALNIPFNLPRKWISSCGLGTMGYGIPAAVGAQLAMPDKLVIAITGDGSFQMGMTELGTISELDLPLKILVFNNNCLGMVRQLQHHYCGERYSQVRFKKALDFMTLAKAFGAEGYKIENIEESENILKEAFNNNKFSIIECLVDPQDLVYPMVLSGDGLDQMTGV
ncbi:acetolactate synthase, large subunit [Desulfonispora thiosulfatigenes DSM 11270]|uniref:Acetolactate synthase n=1 Tax=Desulfonispora thiosulfatigenes DSM 11270 TaxID=656914 RepID=A0A1W1VEG6_DESTI|nr:biosynthetic-type acetolactate synthase large subunit [Desulfonispora thiosulfatigenes]SMB91758.1 acetolactate synthase, large subunit [Desulfonispora thiosulfatigenes DSM 11270]